VLGSFVSDESIKTLLVGAFPVPVADFNGRAEEHLRLARPPHWTILKNFNIVQCWVPRLI